MNYDILVIGAGMAGLAAARTLAEAGLRVLILEAQDRIGGRILTHHVNGQAIELGAEFIHGKPPELWNLIHEAGLTTYEREGTQLCFENGTMDDCPDTRNDTFSLLEDLRNHTGPDLTFAQYLDQHHITGPARDQAIGYVEGFNAADHRLASVAALARQQRAEDKTEGDRVFYIQGGYTQLPDFLATRITGAGGFILLDTPVNAIHWQPGFVKAHTPKGIFTAPQVIITIPLGVLKSGTVDIAPPPVTLPAAAAKLQMGQVCCVTLLFREPFWSTLPPQPATGTLSFLFSSGETFPVWWTSRPEPANLLTGWVGGPRSAALNQLSPAALAQTACESLARIFSLDLAHIQAQLITCETHNWQTDPHSQGVYSYVAVGGLNASAEMSIPVESTLFFAGEHTDTTGHWGTVHAALRSGQRAAAQILAALN